MYSDFAFYRDTYKGTATEETFSRLAVPASAHINRITANRAPTATGADLEAVKMATCAVIDELERQEHGGIITAESNDGISRSFATGTVVKSATQRIDAAAELFLCTTNLMFAGV